ncbi:MAG: Ldh family oxidoreductase [Filomicrobium sp.]
MSTSNILVAELEALVASYLVANNVSQLNAEAVARALVQAEVDGQGGHGLTRIDSYTAQSRAGKVDGHANPVITRTRPGSIMVDVGTGFAYRALEQATDMLPDIARETGIAAAGFVRSHHAGALGQAVERLASSGILAMMFANAPQAMTSWGGRKALFGTNPIAFAAPRKNRPPVIVDLALSEVARGKILAAAQKGEPIPEGWAKDADGKPTTDSKAALKGTVYPAGGAKGAALAFMVEVLSASLVGANHSFEASSLFDAEGGPPALGQFLIVIDPGAFAGSEAFADRLELLASEIEGDEGARIPGYRKLALRETAAKNGISVSDELLEKLRSASSD